MKIMWTCFLFVSFFGASASVPDSKMEGNGEQARGGGEILCGKTHIEDVQSGEGKGTVAGNKGGWGFGSKSGLSGVKANNNTLCSSSSSILFTRSSFPFFRFSRSRCCCSWIDHHSGVAAILGLTGADCSFCACARLMYRLSSLSLEPLSPSR